VLKDFVMHCLKSIKPALLSYILPVMAALAVSFAYAQTTTPAGSLTMYLCKQQYALCTSAVCVPQPGDPTKVICKCDVEDGASMASVACDTLQPSTDANGIRTVFSTYSLTQSIQGLKAMTCPGNTPWSQCLNKRCTVDPSNPTKAICICDVVRSPDPWMTLGGNCDTSTCATSYWSGATIPDAYSGGAFMSKALGLDKSPVQWCPVAS
jgi:hypothetical protein